MSSSPTQNENATFSLKKIDENKKYFHDSKTNKNGTDKEDRRSQNSSSPSSSSTSDDESETSSEEKPESYNQNVKKKNIQTTSTIAFSDKGDEVTDESDIEDDLVSAINYNTITSLAALKDMLQSSGEDSEGVDSFFNHYFLSHVNRLPSRNQTHSPYPWGRRLSECREEDEYETEEGKASDSKEICSTQSAEILFGQESKDEQKTSESTVCHPSSSFEKLSPKKTEINIIQNLKNVESQSTSCLASIKVTNCSFISPPSRKSSLRRRNTTGPGMVLPAMDNLSDSASTTFSKISPLQSPHLDKRFFDSSLIEMKSQASSSSTLDYDSTDEIWIRRIDVRQDYKYQNLGSETLPVAGAEGSDSALFFNETHNRPRAGTWDNMTSIQKGLSDYITTPTKSMSRSHQQIESTKKFISSQRDLINKHGRRNNNYESKKSIESFSFASSSPSQKNVRDAFRPRSKSDASKTKKPSIITNMKNVVQLI
ncbi:lisH domain-containing protein C1711.05 [Copidosoma floridanum]|uniref:lisH domain-containing protein C1711.05 n=1 Tax=Copidosoma floridanum TaxID=29053 RepID=UPI000C6F7832|nr:lisH domain-containing protein C1711.05 [Copidosoma floridanum]